MQNRILTPQMPEFRIKPQNGQCLPACVALIFEDYGYISTNNPKQYGYTLSELGKIIPPPYWFDIVYQAPKIQSTPHEELRGLLKYKLGAQAIERIISDLPENTNELIFVPFICTNNNHAFLYLVDRSLNIYGYDLLAGKCGYVRLDSFLESKIDGVAVLTEPVTNSILGIGYEDVRHLFK